MGPCIVNIILYIIYQYIIYYISVLVAAYFIHCSQSIPEAVVTVVRAPDDGCQHPKSVQLPTEI